MPQVVRCTPDYLMRAMFRRLTSLNVLPGGQIVGASLQMVSEQLEEPFQLLICPINLPVDRLYEIDKFGTVFEGVFHIYYRHRNMDDAAYSDDTWLNDPVSGYYAKQHASFLALSSWWPVGDLADSKQNMYLTTGPMRCKTWNEVLRRKWTDRSLGEGMLQINARFVFDQDQLSP